MLSICIPTYRRPDFLQWTLDRLIRDFPFAEIVVSDNDQSGYLPEGVRYLQQKENIGPFENLRSALLAGSGDYCVYCADDDYLLPGPLQAGIEYLDAHPEVVYYCAPCILWDEVKQESNWPAFSLDKHMRFTKEDPVSLFNFVIQQHIWPEHIIYRRSSLEAILEPRTKAYWAFVDLGHALQAGEVHFAPLPFYRNITNHPVGERKKLGDQQCLTDFDEYRAGLEVMTHILFQGQLTDGQRDHINRMITHFICIRLGLAHNLLTRQGKSEDANMIRQRLEIAAPVFA